jgi:GDP-L-fucose synthase
MKVLVTGGSGLVGSHIQKIVEENSDFNLCDFIFISSKDCDLRKRCDIYRVFREVKPNYVIHLAARVGGLYKNINENVEMFSENIKINENILDACNFYNIHKAIFCLSSCIFPINPSKFPMDETMIHESPPHYSNEGYAYAKRMLEVQCRNYNKQYGRSYVCVVPVNLYGEFDNFKIGEAHVIPELIHRMYNYKNNKTLKDNNEKFKAYGSGKPLRQFLYAGDFAKMILNILFFYKPGLMNIKPIICCNNEISIKELVNTIAYIMRVNLYNIEFDTSKLDGCMKKTVTNQYFNSVFPYFNYTPLYEGVEKTINWFENNYEYART